MSFLATRSGLTRVRIFDLSARIKKLASLFIQRHNRAVEESWYSRTVDWNLRFQEDATIITAPFNAYIRLLAKLRQRITQRHPAANDTRANCDPSYLEAGEPSPATDITDQPMQNDDPLTATTAAAGDAIPMSDDGSSSSGETSAQDASNLVPRINYNEYSSYDFLDLLVNSSVHISATQTAIANKGSKQRSPVAVTGLLYDYATFARRFLNSTSLRIRTLDDARPPVAPDPGSPPGATPQQPVTIDICPNGECPTKCGFRNDTIDCLLVDNNGYIVVGEDLPHIGRSLLDYDEKLLASLVERRVFHKIQLMDYQAICTRSDSELSSQQRGSLASSLSANNFNSAGFSSWNPTNSFSLQLLGQLMSNFAACLIWLGSSVISMLAYQSGFTELTEQSMSTIMGQPMHWQLGSSFVGAQSAVANQSVLALLPNKTYLRPCERLVNLYETRPSELSKLTGGDAPEYYVTKCGCSGWYVFDAIPKTNLIMLIVNTTSACRRGCEQAASSVILPPAPPVVASDALNGAPAQPLQPAGNKTAEDQVCAMLEREAQLFWKKPDTCYAQHPEESQIHLCGGANRSAKLDLWLLLLLSALASVGMARISFVTTKSVRTC